MKTLICNSTVLVAACALLAGAGCDRLQTSEPKPPGTSAHEDLLMGYGILADTLSDESHLRALKLLKKVTFRGPVEEVGKAMDVLAKASKQRKNELEDLRKLAPDVTGEPATHSPIGDAITAVAKDVGTHEMLDRDGAFNLRFMLLQAQATRMVSAIATAIAEHEPNAERKKWLGAVASEYEGYRNQIVDVILKYVEGKGAAQAKG
jgi:hypothetical protein